MKKLVFGIAAALLCVGFVTTESEAARLGGARSLGAQRSVTRTPPAAVPAKPAQAQPAAAGAAQPQPASGFAKWAPLLGGLAIGGALGWLMGANGMGGLLVGMLLLGLLVYAAMSVARMLAQKRGGAPVRLQYASLGNETVAAPPPSQAAGFDARLQAAAGGPGPAGVDAAGVPRAARRDHL